MAWDDEIHVLDNFFPDFEQEREKVWEQGFGGMVNPVDGVLYPDISTEIPDSWMEALNDVFRPKDETVFFRLTTKNSGEAPHQAHNDITMGDWTAIAYINKGEYGTSILEHKEADFAGGDPDEQLEVWKRDTNTYAAWKILGVIPAVPNRLVFYPSELMHRAEPVGGFGSNARDGRLVLTMFFNMRSE
jgi:hypothetical protein